MSGLSKQPTFVGLHSDNDSAVRNALTFAYDFSGTDVSSINLGGYSFGGSQYVLDVHAVKSSANIKSLKTIQIVAQFTMGLAGGKGGDPEYDGDLFIYSQSSNQLIRLGLNQDVGFLPPQTNVTGLGGFVTACIPIVTSSPSILTFAKEKNALGNMTGNISVTLFDFSLPAYVTQAGRPLLGAL